MLEKCSNWQIRRVSLLSTGSEILQGQYADTNARYLAERLTLSGITVTSITAAPDSQESIERALRFSAGHSDLVICTGGLGPTRDDVNRFVFEKAFNRALVRDEEAIQAMGRRFLSRGLGPMPESNEVQAMLPDGCIPFYNRWGTAPGFLLPPGDDGELKHCGLLALPGPPSEMIPMFEKLALPELQKHFVHGRLGKIRSIHTYGHAESHIGTLVEDLFKDEHDVEFSILAKRHGVDLRIRAMGDSETSVQSHLDDTESRVRKLLDPSMIYGVDDDNIATAVGKLLRSTGKRVTTAESCTGGMIAEMLTDIPGSSDYVEECHVTYSNEAKVRVLGVKPDTLNAHGAVSENVSVEMAEGARRISGADYAISVTGIAGPDGGTIEKPVGLVYISIATPSETHTVKNQLLGNRSENREQSARIALNMLRLEILKNRQ